MTSVSVNNGKMEVPSILLAPTAVNIGNLAETVIADGFHSKEDVYQETGSGSLVSYVKVMEI